MTNFKKCLNMCATIGNLPSSYVDSLSYEEQLLWLCKFIEEKIYPAIDNLQPYVDKKIEEMAESGELEEIISQYINIKTQLVFDTVADMKSSTALLDGSYAKTLGYHSLNDGGMATYKIREITNQDTVDEGNIIALNDDSLIAELIITDHVTPEMFGAVGDGVADDTEALQMALNKNNKLILSKVYLISDDLYATSRADIEGSGTNTIIKSDNPVNLYVGYTASSNEYWGKTISNIRFKNVTLFMGKTSTDRCLGITISDCYWSNSDIWCIVTKHQCAFLHFNNLFADNVKGLIYVNGSDENNESVVNSGSTVKIENCTCVNSSVSGLYIKDTGNDGFSYTVDNCSFEHMPYSVYITGTSRGLLYLMLNNLHCELNTTGCVYSDITGSPRIKVNYPWIHNGSSVNTPIFNIANGNLDLIGGYIYRSSGQAILNGGCRLYIDPTTTNYNILSEDILASTYTGTVKMVDNIYNANKDSWTGSRTKDLLYCKTKPFEHMHLSYLVQTTLTNLPTYALRLDGANLLTYTPVNTSVKYIGIEMEINNGSADVTFTSYNNTFEVVKSYRKIKATLNHTVGLFITEVATSEDSFETLEHTISC